MVCVQLGSNKGDRRAKLQEAISRIEKLGKIVRLSSIYETAAWGKTDQESFYNQLLLLETTINPFALLRHTQEIELLMGRVKAEKWGPRIIDIDIIYYDQKVIYSPALKIPHELFTDRRFILEPLTEISKKWKHPLYGYNVPELLEQCPDKTRVKRIAFNGE